MRCAICGIQIDLVEDAIQQGWVPSFYDELDTEHQPACGDCARLFLHSGPDGEWEVKPQYRGKLKYLDESGDEVWQDYSEVVSTVLENEPGKLN